MRQKLGDGNWVALSVVFLVFNGFVELRGQDNLPALIKRVQPSVLTIVTYDKGHNLLKRGSGFFVSAAGDIVTARHVMEGAYSAVIECQGEKGRFVKNVLAEDSKADLIRVSSDLVPGALAAWLLSDDEPWTVATVNATLPDIGERILVIGAPLGFDQTASEGIVSAIRTLEPYGQVIQITAPISAGSSGFEYAGGSDRCCQFTGQ